MSLTLLSQMDIKQLVPYLKLQSLGRQQLLPVLRLKVTVGGTKQLHKPAVPAVYPGHILLSVHLLGDGQGIHPVKVRHRHLCR